MSDTYIFVVDTEQYAGNFEREMCAYMTGRVGDCGVGQELANTYEEEFGEALEFIIDRSDDHGCFRPVAVWPTPGWFNNGMGGNFREGEEVEAKEHHRKECLNYAMKYPDQGDHEKRWKDNAEAPLQKHHAYLSFAIFMDREPSQAEVDILMQRAKVFAEKKEIVITGFRLLQENVSTTTVWKKN